MKKLILLFAAFCLLAGAPIQAQDTLTLTRVPETKAPELKFIGYWFARGTASNISTTNDLLRAQIIGRLFGSNTTTTWERTAVYSEQRFVPMFIYTPQILDGVATFRSLFKVDMTWGDNSYSVGGNAGGSINAGQVNLQTLMANVEIRPRNADWNVVLGLQRIFDNARDPNLVALSTFQTSSYKLSYWGTQGVGISLYGNINKTTFGKLGYYQLYENLIQSDDDVALWMLDVESLVYPGLEVGADVWYVWDHGINAGGVSVLSQGLNSQLAEYNGAVRLSLPTSKYRSDLFWLGTHASYNRDFQAGRWWADAYVMTNFGNIDTLDDSTSTPGNYASIFGVAVNGQVSYKYGMTAQDKVSLEAMFTTGDNNGADDNQVSSVVTGNVWGAPTGIYSSHRALLLFPDPQVVNRYYSAVHDISNMGLGVTAGFLTVSRDFIPNKFSGKLGFATAISNVAKKDGTGTNSYSYMGSEVNFELKYNVKVFLTVGLSGGYLFLGDFYKSPSAKYNYSSEKPKDPFVIFTSLSWLMF